MVRIARQDTYGLEDIGGVKVKRRIFAGRPFPDHYEVDRGAFDDPSAPPAKAPKAAKAAEPAAADVEEQAQEEPKPKPAGGGRRARSG